MATLATIGQFNRMLANADRWLEIAGEHARQKGFDLEILTQARLAPDQYALTQQIQSACDAAKYAAAYLSGTAAPSHPDSEKTIAELRARIAKCRAYIGAFTESNFADAEQRQVSPPWMQGHSVSGSAYLTRIAVPNFYFHVATAYAILRHNGVTLGKRDYIGVQSWQDLASAD